jgi:hypothetical protein
MQLMINNPYDRVFEWIPYDQFIGVRVIRENKFAIIYSAIWKYNPLKGNKRNSLNSLDIEDEYEKINLIRSQNITNELNEFLNKV